DLPITLMLYFNMILARGPERFFSDLAHAGVDGVLIVDLPPEMASEVYDIAQHHGIRLIFIVSPLTTPGRLTRMTRYAQGFLYVVSRLGVTGTEADYDAELSELFNRIHAHTALPACVGFGISTPEQATHMLAQGADGIITGSHIIQLIRQTPPEHSLSMLKA